MSRLFTMPRGSTQVGKYDAHCHVPSTKNLSWKSPGFSDSKIQCSPSDPRSMSTRVCQLSQLPEMLTACASPPQKRRVGTVKTSSSSMNAEGAMTSFPVEVGKWCGVSRWCECVEERAEITGGTEDDAMDGDVVDDAGVPLIKRGSDAR